MSRQPTSSHPLPSSLARQIAEDAVKRAKAYGTRRGWKAQARLRPLWADGNVGIRDPLKFLVYQDRGTKPRLMHEVEGKLIPIKNNGKVTFVRGKDVGKPGWGGPPGARVWKQQKWRHPGIKPTHFMRDSIRDAIKAHEGAISDKLARTVRSGDSSHDYFLGHGNAGQGRL